MKQDLDADTVRTLFGAIADDLVLLGALQAVELEAEMLAELKALGFPEGLGLKLSSDASGRIVKHLRQEVASWPDEADSAFMDSLAADFAAIYLNGQIGASPCESYWLDEDRLVMQKPMFQVRDRYREHGIRVENWQHRADDHLVNELVFMAELLRPGIEGGTLDAAACFLDEHLLRWVDQFADRVAGFSESDFYSGVTLLTAAYCNELRDLLELILEEPRPDPEKIEARMREMEAEAIQVAPPRMGDGPTW